jgi:hypothetical protein
LEDETDFAVADISQLVVVEGFNRLSVQNIFTRGGQVRQPRMFISVDFPEPEGPMMATTSPRSILHETPAKARTST